MEESETQAEEANEVFDPPPVVAVVVASNPGDHFAEMLDSLGEQDYDNLSVLVIDAGSDAPIADRVAEVLPEAYIHRLAGTPGWSVAANQAMELVSGSPFLLFCHDDVALAPDCVTTLMGELYRRNAGIAGPKLVQWDNPERLLQVGMSSDRFGVAVDQVERGEYDQDQYDAVRDIFVIPGGVQLVRADLFEALGGFDRGISVVGEDLDLCWRAHVVGARVLIVPSASARHLESMATRFPLAERRRFATQHRLRTVMATASRRAQYTIVPITILLIVLEGIYTLFLGRRRQAKDSFGAIAWNFARFGDIRQRRRELMAIRNSSDADIRSLQVGGSARINDFSRGQFNAGQDRFSGLANSIRSSFAGEDAGSLRDAAIVLAGLFAILILGSRHLITQGVDSVGSFPSLPATSTMLREWFGGWRTTGTGGPGNPPTGLLLLGIARLPFFWSTGLFDSLLAVGPLFIGTIGAYRLARPLGSPRAAAVAAAFYGLNPVVVSAFASGGWDSLVVWAAVPFLLGSALRFLDVSPFVPSERDESSLAKEWVVDRSIQLRIIRFGLLVAFVTSFAPTIIPVALILCFFLSITAILMQQFKQLRNLLLAAVVSVVAPAVLHAPWTFDVMQQFSWEWLTGPGSAERFFDSFADLVRFAPGSISPTMLAVGFFVGGLAGVAVALKEQRPVAVRSLCLVILAWLLVWADRRSWVPFTLPAPETILSLAAVGLALCAAIATRWFEITKLELNRSRRLLVVSGSVVVAVAVTLTGFRSALLGDWGVPDQGYRSFTELLSQRSDATTRTLWIGDPSVLPLDGTRSSSGINFAMTDGGTPDVRGRWAPKAVGSEAGVAAQLDLAAAGEVSNLGHLLAPYGIDLIVLIEQLAPAPYEGLRLDAGGNANVVFSRQLDLKRIDGFAELGVFENTASSGIATAMTSADAVSSRTPSQQLGIDLGGSPVVAVNPQPGRWIVDVPADVPVLVAIPNSNLDVSGARSEVLSGFDDMTIIPAGEAGLVELRYGAPWKRRFAILGQILIVAVGIVLAQTRKEEVTL